MKKNDWIGLGTSVLLHGLLLVFFALLNVGASEPQPIGYIQVDFGEYSEGRPVRQTQEPAPEVEPEPPTEKPKPIEEPKPERTPPAEARPVDLPDEEIVDEEKIEAPKAKEIAPTTNPDPTEKIGPEAKPEPKPVQPLGGGDPEGTTGAETGDDGEGQDEVAAAPFQIEGLNRRPVQTPLPRYAEKVNATIRVRITVDPQGRIVQRIPLIKGNPSLEQAVMDALQRWRFNPLPANAPQEPQTGTITFQFRLES